MATKLKSVEGELSEIDRTRNIAQRIAAVMGEVDYVQKEKKQGMNYSIVSHDAVTAKVRPLLHKHGIVYYPRALTVGQNGNRTEAVFTVRFENIDDRTDFIDVETFGYGVDAQDKGPGKAMSYGVKYALLKVLGLETGDDPDTVQDAKADFRPKTDEEPPAKRVQLDGVYKSKSALWAAVRQFVHTLNGIDDLGEFEGFLQTDEVVELLDQCKRDAPQLLDTGEGMPEEYAPLLPLIKRMRAELTSADEIRTLHGPVDA